MKEKLLDTLFEIAITLLTLGFIFALPVIYYIFIPSLFWKGFLIGAHIMLLISFIIMS